MEIKDGANTVLKHRYDGLGRRIAKLIYSGGSLSQTRHYYLNNQQAVEERLNTGTAADRQNVWGLAACIDEPT